MEFNFLRQPIFCKPMKIIQVSLSRLIALGTGVTLC